LDETKDCKKLQSHIQSFNPSLGIEEAVICNSYKITDLPIAIKPKMAVLNVANHTIIGFENAAKIPKQTYIDAS